MHIDCEGLHINMGAYVTSSVWLQLALKAAKNKLKSVTTKIRKLNVTDERV